MSQQNSRKSTFRSGTDYLSATIIFGARPMVRLWTLNSEIEVRILSTEPFPMPVTPLPNGQARDCKSRYPGSNPGGVSIFPSSSVVRATSLISRMSPVRIQPGEPGFVCCQDYQLETCVAEMLLHQGCCVMPMQSRVQGYNCWSYARIKGSRGVPTTYCHSPQQLLSTISEP